MPHVLKSPVVLACLIAVLFTAPLLVESLTAWVLPILGLGLGLGAWLARSEGTRVVGVAPWERDLNAELARRGRGAVLWCCLDQIDSFRSGYGDLATEAMLSRQLKRLKAAASEVVVIAREGDAFVLMAPNRTNLGALSQAVTQLLEEPLEWRGETLAMTVSVGGVLYPEQDAPARLLRELTRLQARNHHVVRTSSLIELGTLLKALP